MIYFPRTVFQKGGFKHLKKVYLLLSSTGTLPSKVVRFLTHREYAHVSIALVPSADRFYSYARRKIHNPLIGGLVEENTRTGVFGLYPNTNCELLELLVDDTAYKKLETLLAYHLANYDKCKYSFSAIVPMALGIKQKLGLKMTCSQFVATILENSGACKLPRHPSLMYPCDFLKLSNAKIIYKGNLKNLSFEKLDCKIKYKK